MANWRPKTTGTDSERIALDGIAQILGMIEDQLTKIANNGTAQAQTLSEIARKIK